MFEHRFYRQNIKAKGLFQFEVKIDETDIAVWANKDLSNLALEVIHNLRHQIKEYIKFNYSFSKTLEAVAVDKKAPKIIQDMQTASLKASVGPMTAVAGAVAEYLAVELRRHSREIIVENGGDIYIDTQSERLIQIYAGKSVLSGKIAIRIRPDDMPLGICTSSASVGHSLSFGIADACCVMGKSACVADAFATAIGNSIKDKDNMDKVLDSFDFPGDVLGTVAIVADKLAYIGDIDIVRI